MPTYVYETNHDDWRRTITGVCRLEFMRSYCEQRRLALADGSDPATRDFVQAYGAGYRDLVSFWFLQAGKEAAK